MSIRTSLRPIVIIIILSQLSSSRQLPHSIRFDSGLLSPTPNQYTCSLVIAWESGATFGEWSSALADGIAILSAKPPIAEGPKAGSVGFSPINLLIQSSAKLSVYYSASSLLDCAYSTLSTMVLF